MAFMLKTISVSRKNCIVYTQTHKQTNKQYDLSYSHPHATNHDLPECAPKPIGAQEGRAGDAGLAGLRG